MAERLRHIDVGAGIMILWMVIFHAMYAGLTWGTTTAINPMQLFPFLLFFMPWFFYKSGMLFKYRTIKELFTHDWEKLLKPWLIWALLGYILYVILSVIDGTATLRGLTYTTFKTAFFTEKLPINNALWFLISLYIVRFISNIALKKVHPLLIAILGFVLAYICHIINSKWIPDWVANINSGLCFFALGYYVNNRLIVSERVKKLSGLVSLGLFSIWCIVSYLMPSDSIWIVPEVEMVNNKLIQGVYLSWYPVCIVGIIAFNYLTQALRNGVYVKILEWFGLNAMLIYVTHYLLRYIIPWTCAKYLPSIKGQELFGCILISYCFLLAVIKLYTQNRENKTRICNA